MSNGPSAPPPDDALGDLTQQQVEQERDLLQGEADTNGWRVVFTEIQQANGSWTLRIRYDFSANDPPSVPDFTPPNASTLPPVINSHNLADLSSEYELCWNACAIAPSKQSEVDSETNRMLKNQTRYQAVQLRTPKSVPWQLIGIMHGLECGYNFSEHLHNGDPLAAKTVHVPAGRPPGWDGTGTWEDSAVDAVTWRFPAVTAWNLPTVLFALESFNGFGYRQYNIRSPYLWSFSNLYTKGLYYPDHVFNATLVSKQVGAALILKTLEARRLWP